MADLTLERLAAWFEETGKYLGHYDAAPVLDRLREELAASVAENFAGHHTPGDVPWAPLKVPDHEPLVVTGDLRAAAVESAWHSVTDAGGMAFDPSALPPYWRTHQFGRGPVPAREFIGFPPAFLDEACGALADDVLEHMQPP